MPHIDSRYPIWDDPDFVRKYDEGRFYLPDAPTGRREMIVTTVLDAQPIQNLGAGPSWVPMIAAAADRELGGILMLAIGGSVYLVGGLALVGTVLRTPAAHRNDGR